MSNPSADFPGAVHTPTDAGALSGFGLGATSPTQTQLAGKAEQELVATQTKLGRGASTPGANKILIGAVDNSTSWQSLGSIRHVLSGVLVACYDADDADKAIANEVLDGTADDVQISAYLAAGLHVYVSSGTANLANPIAIVGDDTADSATQRLHGQGNEKTFLQAANNTHVIELDGGPKVDLQYFCLIFGGTGSGIVANAQASAPYRGFWNSTFANLYFKGDFSTGTGWGMDLEAPFRSTFENLEGNGVGNGIRLKSTNSNFNPGNCTFIRCFMDLKGAVNGTAYELYTADGGGLFNICTFIQCEAIDSAASTSSVGWHLRGSSSSFYTTRNIHVIQSNVEQFNIDVKLEHAVDNYIQLSYADTKTGGTMFSVSADSVSNRLYCDTSYVGPSATMKFINDLNTSTTAPTITGGLHVYVDTGATLSNTLSTSTIIERCTAEGPGTIDPSFVFALPANRLQRVDISATAPTAAGQILTTTGTTGASWQAKKRAGTTTSSATPTINTDNIDFYSLTAQAAAITSFTTNLTGTPVAGQTLWIAITDDGTARAITWGSKFEASGAQALPTTTVISTRLDVGFIWNTATSKWRCIAAA